MSQSKPRALPTSTIVITGVTRGLGCAMVDEFVRRGQTVIGCARTQNGIETLNRTYPRHNFQVVDVASEAEVKEWAERVIRIHGAPDFVLNNAAIINLKAPLWRVDSTEFSEEIDINIKGVFNVIRNFVPSMINRRRGVIVNFISRWGTTFEKQMGPYCATKWAVLALTRVLAEELRPYSVAAIGINPGIIRTDMLQRYLSKPTALETSGLPKPAEWAKIAVPNILRLSLKDTGKLRKVFSDVNPLGKNNIFNGKLTCDNR